MSLSFLGKYRETGLFLLRAGIGLCFVLHGYPKMFGDNNLDRWNGLGHAIRSVGLDFLPDWAFTVFGFLAALSEFGGGICLILGWFFRPACLMMAGTMAVGLAMHVKKGDDFNTYSHALESLVLFVSLMLIGPGKISVERS